MKKTVLILFLSAGLSFAEQTTVFDLGNPDAATMGAINLSGAGSGVLIKLG